MSRLSDLPISSEQEIIDRVLLTVHKAIDDHFPTVSQPKSRQFTKTVFGDQGEHTAIVRTSVATEDSDSISHSISSASALGAPTTAESVPTPPKATSKPAPADADELPPPTKSAVVPRSLAPKKKRSAAINSQPESRLDAGASQGPSQITSQLSQFSEYETTQKSDWITRIGIFMLLVGVAAVLYIAFR